MHKTRIKVSAVVTLAALVTSTSASALEWRGRSNDLYPSFEACWAHESTCFLVGKLIKKSRAEIMNKDAAANRKRANDVYYTTEEPAANAKSKLIAACLSAGGGISKRPCTSKQQKIYIEV